MSLESWINEFYPIKAKALQNHDDEELIQHSLLKWTGALSENCVKHDVEYINHCIISLDACEELSFNGDTCALCAKYYTPHEDDKEACGLCPLKQSLGGDPCDYGICSPWKRAKNEPSPMLTALQYALKSIGVPHV